jgi:hypothetical protein
VRRLKVEGLNGTEIVSTPEHPFYGANKDYRLSDCHPATRFKHRGTKRVALLRPEVGWREAQSLQPGDYVSTGLGCEEVPLEVDYRIAPPRVHKVWPVRGGWRGSVRVEGKPYGIWRSTEDAAALAIAEVYDEKCWKSVKVDERLAYLLGWYVAEGSLDSDPRRRTQTTFDLAASEQAVANELAAIAADVFGAKSCRQIRRVSGLRLNIASYALAQVLAQLVGTGTKTKKLAPGLLTMPLP